MPRGIKVAVVRAILKKEVKKCVLNYRLISILSVVSLIMERFAFITMMSFCEQYSLLCSSQYDFRQNKGTPSLLEDLCDHIHENIDRDSIVLTLFLGLKKAFDTIDHGLLVHKLEQLDFRSPLIDFLTDYLSKRQQLVKIGDAKSQVLILRHGLPRKYT